MPRALVYNDQEAYCGMRLINRLR